MKMLGQVREKTLNSILSKALKYLVERMALPVVEKIKMWAK